MAVYQQCPVCKENGKTLVPIKRDACSCGENLAKARKSSRVRYWIIYRLPDGRQKKEYVGMSLQEATRKDKEVGAVTPLDRVGRASNWTYKDLFDWYEAEILANQEISSKDRVSGCLNNWQAVFPRLRVNKSHRGTIKRYEKTRKAQGAAPRTIDMEVGYVAKAVDDAGCAEGVPVSSTLHTRVFRKRKKLLVKGSNITRRTLATAEYLALLEVASDGLKALLVAGFNTGMRFGELAQLKWPHVDMKERMIRFPKELTKEDKIRGGSEEDYKLVPLNRYMVELLMSLPRHDHGHVFTYRGQPYQRSPRKALANACEKVGIPYGEKHVSFKTLRKTFKTNMVEAEVEPSYRDTIMGHSQKGMDPHYIHPSESELHKAMKKFTRHLDKVFALDVAPTGT